MSNKPKQIQISEQFFKELCVFVLYEDCRSKEFTDKLQKQIFDKMDRIKNHQLYSKYKAGSEDARQEYLDRVGIPQDFRAPEGYKF